MNLIAKTASPGPRESVPTQGLCKFIDLSSTTLMLLDDFEFAKSVGDRVIELTPKGVIDRLNSFDDYIVDNKVKELRKKLYS